jgi:hypothetical protein
MTSPFAYRHKYYTPDVHIESMGYDCLIAQSPLEDVVEGCEWEWED